MPDGLREKFLEGIIPDELKEEIISALRCFGEDPERIDDVEIGDNGDVYLGLTKIIEGNPERDYFISIA